MQKIISSKEKQEYLMFSKYTRTIMDSDSIYREQKNPTPPHPPTPEIQQTRLNIWDQNQGVIGLISLLQNLRCYFVVCQLQLRISLFMCFTALLLLCVLCLSMISGYKFGSRIFICLIFCSIHFPHRSKPNRSI